MIPTRTSLDMRPSSRATSCGWWIWRAVFESPDAAMRLANVCSRREGTESPTRNTSITDVESAEYRIV